MLNKTSLELAKFILVCICRINMKFRRKLTIKVSRVPTVNDGTSNLNISIQTKHHVRFMVMGGEVRILVCSFLVFPWQHKICSTTNAPMPRLSHGRFDENKTYQQRAFLGKHPPLASCGTLAPERLPHWRWLR